MTIGESVGHFGHPNFAGAFRSGRVARYCGRSILKIVVNSAQISPASCALDRI
jgi:hypothetical protein